MSDFELCRECDRSMDCRELKECRADCLICGGDGTVDGSDYGDPLWDDDYNDPFATCPSCGGSGLAKDMTFC